MPQSDFWPFGLKKPRTEDEINAEETSVLQKQLGDMEGEVKEIQMELAAMRKDRMGLTNQRQRMYTDTDEILKDSIGRNEVKHKLYEEKSEQFSEAVMLREELIRTKNIANEERCQREKYESKLKDLEKKLNTICCTGMMTDVKMPRRFSEEEVSALKFQIRDLKEETEELRITVNEKTEQLQEYRVKYLQAQQQVEELKRHLDVIEFDNRQVSDQIQIEIQKMKMQFQEKLQELVPLPELLKAAQIQLQEAKQLQRLAEDSSLQLSNELHRVKEKLVLAVNNLNQEKHEKVKLTDEYKAMIVNANEKEREIEELQKTIDDLKCQVLRLQEKFCQEELRYKEKANESSQLLKDLEEIKEESNRSQGRYKERSESMRRYLQTQISELERQLIQSRAQCRACQKERDEIRQRMQIQISNLQENFELVEIRLRALQNQVTSLKNSYTVILADDEDVGELNKIATSLVQQ